MKGESTYRHVSRRERALRAVSLFVLGTLVIVGGTFNAISWSAPAWLIVDVVGLVSMLASYQAWTTTQRKVPAPATSSPPKTQRLWIYGDDARHGWRAWFATSGAVGGWALYSAGSIYMFLYGTNNAHWSNSWLMPAIGGLGCLTAFFVAPAGAAEIWSVMVRRSSIEVAEKNRHKAGVVTAWIVVCIIAIAVFFALPASWHRDIWYAVLVILVLWQIDNYIRSKLRDLESAAAARDARLNERLDSLQREIARLNGDSKQNWGDGSY